MIYVKVNNVLYPASIAGKIEDRQWDDRKVKAITLTMAYADVVALFPNDVAWSIVTEDVDEAGNPVVEEYDNSMYSISGDITDHRDGTCTILMGMSTDLEDAYEMLYGGE